MSSPLTIKVPPIPVSLVADEMAFVLKRRIEVVKLRESDNWYYDAGCHAVVRKLTALVAKALLQDPNWHYRQYSWQLPGIEKHDYKSIIEHGYPCFLDGQDGKRLMIREDGDQIKIHHMNPLNIRTDEDMIKIHHMNPLNMNPLNHFNPFSIVRATIEVDALCKKLLQSKEGQVVKITI